MEQKQEQTSVVLGENLLPNAVYHSIGGLEVPGVTIKQFNDLITELENTFAVSAQQVIETGAYSFSMVARHALGLSAQGGIVSIIASDCLAGQVALNCARYLVHSGAACHVAFLGATQTALTINTLRGLEAINVVVQRLQNTTRLENWLATSTERSQHMLVGLDAESAHKHLEGMASLNESICPVHAVQLPPGINPDSGFMSKGAIFASSTLSLGVPLNGLSEAREQTGRHYLCDISLPTALTDANGVHKSLFHDQPVQTLLFERPQLSH
jgi:NAD(P)H-hydrate repair Nnr-like enzyme with NAD(P)H-hydrate epimerase domain